MTTSSCNCMTATLSAEAAAPVLLMLQKLYLFVNLLNLPVIAINGLTLSSSFDRSSQIKWALAWTKSMLTGTWYYNQPFDQVLIIFSIYSVVELLEYVLLALTFIPVLTHSLTPSALSQTVHSLPSVSLILQHMPTIRSPLSSQVITSNFSSIPNVFHIFFLDCTRWCRFSNLTHVGKKSQYY